MSANASLRERSDGSLDHAIIPSDPTNPPEWRTILDSVDLDAIKTYADADRILRARVDELADAYRYEHGFYEWDEWTRDAFHRTSEVQRATLAVAECRAGQTRLLFGANVVNTADLPPDVQPIVWRSFVAHGHEPECWPGDVVAAIRKAPSRRTHGELFEERRAHLRLDAQLATRRTIEQHGDNPAEWPIEALDEVARAKARVDAFELVAHEARRLDTSWDSRKVAHTPAPVVTKTEQEIAADAEAVEREKALTAYHALAAEVQQADFAVQTHDGETEMLQRLAANDCTPELRANRKRERAQLAKKLEAARDALEKGLAS